MKTLIISSSTFASNTCNGDSKSLDAIIIIAWRKQIRVEMEQTLESTSSKEKQTVA